MESKKVKKRIIVSLLIILPILGYADNFEVDGIKYNTTGWNTVEVMSLSSSSNPRTGVLVIPEKVTYLGITYTVTGIGYRFAPGSGITSVTFPNSITYISGFNGCDSLTSITIPNSVTSLGGFRNCRGLTSINIPNSVTFLAAFSGCTGLTSVTIPNSVIEIGYSAFEGCSGITSINIPNSVTSIGENAFSSCTGLTSVNIPNSVESIGRGAFKDCTGLPTIGGIRYADTYLVEVVDKTQPTYKIKAGTRFIGSSAFIDCTSLTSLNIPNSITSIGDLAFSGCTGLTSINIPNSVNYIGPGAFRDCTGLPTVDGLKYADTYLIEPIDKTQSTYSIKADTRYIGGRAFKHCLNLTSITIPSGVKMINWNCLYGCTSLEEIHSNATAPPICYDNTFGNMNTNDCKLYVPIGSRGTYMLAEGWKYFPNIIEEKVDKVESSIQEIKSVSYYDTKGDMLAGPQEGMNIVVTTYSDGSSASTKELR